MFRYKISFLDQSYANQRIIVFMRTDGLVVEMMRAWREESSSYHEIKKSLDVMVSTNLDDFELHDPFKQSFPLAMIKSWNDQHCPPLYVGRPELYSKVDVEDPLYTSMMSKGRFVILPAESKKIGAYYLFSHEMTERGGLNGLCPHIVVSHDELLESEIEELENLFILAAQPLTVVPEED